MDQRRSGAAQWVEIKRNGRVLIIERREDESVEALWDRIDNPPPVAKVTCWASGDTEYEVHTTPQPGETQEECEERHEQAVAEGQERHPKTGECAP